jgi:hypothetical protein
MRVRDGCVFPFPLCGTVASRRGLAVAVAVAFGWSFLDWSYVLRTTDAVADFVWTHYTKESWVWPPT